MGTYFDVSSHFFGSTVFFINLATDFVSILVRSSKSMNFDAFGGTTGRCDTIVLSNSCYHVSPPPYMLDIDFIAANAVQPVVCVGSVNPGSDVTVTISFIDPEDPPAALPNVVEHEVQCSTSSNSVSYTIDSKTPNSFHFKGLGENGSVTVSNMKSDQLWVWAYFYDG